MYKYVWNHLLIFIAGGRAYCITNTYWNKGSKGRNPNFAAALTTKNPIPGSKKSLAMMILMRTNGLMLDDRMPAISGQYQQITTNYMYCFRSNYYS
jgi:hypothetical protein